MDRQGFGPHGVRKDSPAAEWQAAWQAEMGDVKAGSAFASKQSDAQKEGFGSDGVRRDSPASRRQSQMGEVPADSEFSRLQSEGAGK